MDYKKPFANWSLLEAKELCTLLCVHAVPCSGCPLEAACREPLFKMGTPRSWHLKDGSSFSKSGDMSFGESKQNFPNIKAVNQIVAASLGDAILDKPFQEWTLRETKTMCELLHDNKISCKECPFEISCSKYEMYLPKHWSIEEKPLFTKSEVNFAKAIQSLFPNVISIKRLEDEALRMVTDDGAQTAPWAYLEPWRFPSIMAGQCVKIEDIIQCDDDPPQKS